MMKRIIPISFILIGFMISSCQPEEEKETTSVDEELHGGLQEDTPKEHNVVWNHKYYLLEFDSAYAGFHHPYGIGVTQSYIKFYCLFKEKNSGEIFRFFVGVGPSMYGNADYHLYVADEVQSKLDVAEDCIPFGYSEFPMQIGSGMVLAGSDNFNGIYVYRSTTSNLAIDLVSYSTYFENTDRLADFHIIVSADNLYMNLEGKLRAQGQN